MSPAPGPDAKADQAHRPEAVDFGLDTPDAFDISDDENIFTCPPDTPSCILPAPATDSDSSSDSNQTTPTANHIDSHHKHVANILLDFKPPNNKPKPRIRKPKKQHPGMVNLHQKLAEKRRNKAARSAQRPVAQPAPQPAPSPDPSTLKKKGSRKRPYAGSSSSLNAPPTHTHPHKKARKAELYTLKTQLAEHAAANNQLLTHNTDLIAIANETTSQCDRMQQQQVKNKAAITDLKSRLEKHTKAHTSIAQELNNLKKEHNELKEANIDLTAQFMDLSNAHARLNDDYDALKSQHTNNDPSPDVHALQLELQSLENLKHERKAIIADNDSLVEKTNKLTNDNYDLADRLDNLTETYNRACARITHLESLQTGHINANNSDLLAANRVLQSRLATALRNEKKHINLLYQFKAKIILQPRVLRASFNRN